MIKIKDIAGYLEGIAPLALQESYDNSGLITGDPDQQVERILVTLDVTEEVVEEAFRENCQLIVAHHPIVFKGLKRLTGASYVERTVIKAIRQGIGIYAIHTNLDNVSDGVNKALAEKLGLENLQILLPKENLLKKLITFIPEADTEKVLQAIHIAGAGKIGNYSECSYRSEGTGTFRPNEKANPAIGEANNLEYVKEIRAEVIFPSSNEKRVIEALLSAHPYEVPAYDILTLDNTAEFAGAGMIGYLKEPVGEMEFLKNLKQKLQAGCVRHTKLLNKPIRKVAVCGGSGSFLLKAALRKKADIFVTADFKYHEFFDAENQILIADVGHYESEVHTKELISDILQNNFANIAVILANTVTNPISYL